MISTARCSGVDPYTILALLTFGAFLLYLVRILTIQNNLVLSSIFGRSFDRQEDRVERLYSCLLRGRDLWRNC